MYLIKFMINMILMNDFMSLGIHRLWKKNLYKYDESFKKSKIN